MLSPPFLFVGLRYIRAKRRHQFISFVSGFSLVGMALGTMALIVVLSVMNGFDREIKQRILSVVPHGFVDQLPAMTDWQGIAGELQTREEISAAVPYIGGFAMLSSARGVQGVEIQGVLPTEEVRVSAINNYMREGRFDSLQPGRFGIITGSLVARYLGVSTGDTLVMTLPQVSVTPAGLFPRVKRLQVVGIFEVGAQVDQSLALIHLADAGRLFRYGNNVQGLRLQTTDIYRAGSIIEALQADLDKEWGDGFVLKDWTQTQGSLFRAITMEKRMVTVLLMIIIAVAALNIVTSLVLMVSDKRGDIAVLRTLGMTRRQIMGVFVVQGSAVGVMGIIAGLSSGCLLAVGISDVVSWFEQLLELYIFDPDVYFISQMPSELRVGDVLLVCSSTLVMSVLATLYPAWRATTIEPAGVLCYE